MNVKKGKCRGRVGEWSGETNKINQVAFAQHLLHEKQRLHQGDIHSGKLGTQKGFDGAGDQKSMKGDMCEKNTLEPYYPKV